MLPQSLASACGVKILQQGGSAADAAAVAMAAVLNVVEPCSTGIGGDAFALYFDSKTSKVSCLLGNGASSEHLTMEYLQSIGIGNADGMKALDPRSGLCVNVPGAASLWDDLSSHFGRLPLLQILTPAIDLADNGFPIGPITANQWANAYLQGEEAIRVFRTPPANWVHGTSSGMKYPSMGDIIRNTDLANTFRSLGEHGARGGFYNNYIGEAIITACREYGGVLTADDLDSHYTEDVTPIRILYQNHYIYECPPPTHGLAALLALNLIEATETRMQHPICQLIKCM